MNHHAEVMHGLACRYRDRYRLLIDARMTPGCTGWLLSRLMIWADGARLDYLEAGGTEDGLADIEARVSRERRPGFYYQSNNRQIAREPIWEFLAREEPASDWDWKGDTPVYDTSLGNIIQQIDDEDADPRDADNGGA